MFRYICAIWDTSASLQTEFALKIAEQLTRPSSQWHAALKQPGMFVLCAGVNARSVGPHVLADQRGVVLGTLFRRNADAHCSHLWADELQSQEGTQIVRSHGRSLIQNYWGNYVAFLQDPEIQTWRVLRGPASALPCLMAKCRGVTFFFSRMTDYASLELHTFAINWKYVARHLFGPVRSTSTGLNEISEIAPATCVEVRRATLTSTTYWDPFEVAQSRPIETPEQAVASLREAARHCVHAWASCHESIVHHLSGGLDSSIVLACLSDAPTRPSVSCVTEHSPGVDSDERVFARAMAARARCRLTEERRDATFPIEEILSIPKMESPSGYIRRLETTKVERRIAQAAQATAAFSGIGGDELFCRHHTQYYVSDFVREHGLRMTQLGKLLSLALDSAVNEGCTIWTILRQALRDGLFPYRRDLIQELIHDDMQDKLFLREDVARELSKDGSRGLVANKTTKECSPGRLWQVYLVTSRFDYYNPFGIDTDPEPVAPLLSLPLIEVCLRIPTYFQREERWERAIARKAFASDLPTEIAWRRSKGGMEEHASEILARNIGFIRSLLMDGVLVRERLVDRAKLEAALDGGPEALDAGLAQIFHLLSTEVWARSWFAAELRVAA